MQPRLPSSQHDRLPPLTALLTDVHSESRDDNRFWTHVGSNSMIVVTADNNDCSSGSSHVNSANTSANSNPTRTSDIFTRVGTRARSYSYISTHVLNDNRTGVSIPSCTSNLSCATQNSLAFSLPNPRQMVSHQPSSMSNDNYTSSNPKDFYTSPPLHINESTYDVQRDAIPVSPVSTTSSTVNAADPMISNHQASRRLSVSHTIPTNPLSTHVTPSATTSMTSVAQQSAANLAVYSTSSLSPLSPLFPATPSATFSYGNTPKLNSIQVPFDHLLSPSNGMFTQLINDKICLI
jgi:hypothetical protein